MSGVSPLTTSVISALASRIHRGELPSGRTLPSERELSIEFGVSRAVVRTALAELGNMGLVESKPRCRPVVAAKSLKGSKWSHANHRQIAIWIWPDTGDYGASMILKGIHRVATAPNIRITMTTAHGPDWDSILDEEAKYLRTIAHDPHTCGAILWYLGGKRNLSALQELRSAGVPIVFVDRLPPTKLDGDFVGTDNEGAAFQAVSYLYDQGHRHIACVSNTEEVSTVAARLAGYKSALAASGIPFQPSYMKQVASDDIGAVEAAVQRLLTLPNPPTAIFAVNDHIGLQVHEVLSRMGVNVPDEMSVMGFDGLLRWVPGGGHLTSARQNFERIGQYAAEMLLHRIEGDTPSHFRHVLLEAPTVEQGSTTVPRINNDFSNKSFQQWRSENAHT